MTSGQPPSDPAVPPSLYTREYFLGDVEGHREYAASGGRAVSGRLAHALALARLHPGNRVLDIGCGRGEVVAQAALAGARAIGIDYASAAAELSLSALRSLGEEGAPGAVALASGLRLPFRDACFDIVFLLDVVEHLAMPELAATLSEARRTLRPGGRIVVHTSPNRLFEDVVYPRYVRHVHRLVLEGSRLLGLHDGVLNPLMLPTTPEFPHNSYEDAVHICPHSADSLKRALRSAGFRVHRVEFWEPPARPVYESRRLNLEVRLLDVLRYGRPFSYLPPLNQLFSNHIWLLAERPA